MKCEAEELAEARKFSKIFENFVSYHVVKQATCHRFSKGILGSELVRISRFVAILVRRLIRSDFPCSW